MSDVCIQAVECFGLCTRCHSLLQALQTPGEGTGSPT